VVCRPWSLPTQPVPGSRPLIYGGSDTTTFSAAGGAAAAAGSAADRHISALEAAAAHLVAVEALKVVKAATWTSLDFGQVCGTAGE